jgi:hypothetical protein
MRDRDERMERQERRSRAAGLVVALAAPRGVLLDL